MSYRSVYTLLICSLISVFFGYVASHAHLIMHVIDDFESGSLSGKSVWSASGPAEITIVKPPSTSQDRQGVIGKAGRYSLLIAGNLPEGQSSSVTAPIRQDGSKYSHLRFMLFSGAGPETTITLDLFDDDNADNRVMLDSNGKATDDDCFTYTVTVNWTGWKSIVVPLDAFRDSNPGIGDDTWNPIRQQGSDGLAAIRIACRNSKDGPVRIAIDSIDLLKVEVF